MALPEGLNTACCSMQNSGDESLHTRSLCDAKWANDLHAANPIQMRARTQIGLS